MSMTTLLLFSVVAFIAIVTPGPTVLLALSNGTRFGLRRSCLGMAGAVVSDLVLMAAAALGLGALLAASEFWFSVVKWIGVAYLAWLGLQMLTSRAATAPLPDHDLPSTSGRAVFMRSFLVAVTNPKGYLFVSAFLPQFIAPAQPQLMQYLILAVTFAAIDFVVMFLYALAGARAVRLLRSAGAPWLDRFCGAFMVFAAGSLALYRRGN